jgi:8-oxo-dGTP pyrophosphatase MutT (NUDIX family)
MGSKRRKIATAEVPPVLYASVSRKALRRAVATGTLVRPSGKPIALFERRRQAARQRNGAGVLLRVAGRMAAGAGAAIYPGDGVPFEIAKVPIKFVACAKVPDWLRGLSRVDAAGGIVLAPGKRPRVLLLRKREGRSRRWVLPKGKRERQEPRRSAARREVIEESGLSRVDVGAFLIREHYFDMENGRVVFKEVSYFLMRCPKGCRLKPNRAEGFLEARWSSFQTAFAATNPVRAHRSLRKARNAIRSR